MIGFQGLGGISGVIRADGADVRRAQGADVRRLRWRACRASRHDWLPVPFRRSIFPARRERLADGTRARATVRLSARPIATSGRLRWPWARPSSGRARLWHGRARRAPGAARGRFRWRAKSSRHDRRGRGADVDLRADGATFATFRARTFAGDGGGPVELHGMTGCRCPSGVRSSRRDE